MRVLETEDDFKIDTYSGIFTIRYKNYWIYTYSGKLRLSLLFCLADFYATKEDALNQLTFLRKNIKTLRSQHLGNVTRDLLSEELRIQKYI